MTWVKVRQISQQSNPISGALMNVDEGDFHVRVMTIIHERPTCLIQYGINVQLIQFDDEEMADEWLEEHRKPKWKVTQLEELI